jgi:hypothetical protein
MRIVSLRVDHPRKSSWRYVSVKELTGHIARWAVALSPYECPHNLVDAIRALDHKAYNLLAHKPLFHRVGFCKMTERQIKTIVESLVLDTPELKEWNRCRSGKTPEVLGVSTHWLSPHPDNDFIDLHALVLQVMSDLRKDWAAFDDESARQKKIVYKKTKAPTTMTSVL